MSGGGEFNPDDFPVEKAVEPKPLTTLERITVLGDLANAVKNTEIVAAINAARGGERLYELFVRAVESEIERLMNPQQETPKIMTTAADTAERVLENVHRVGAVFAAIEQGPTLAVLISFLQNLGGSLPQRQGQQPQQQQAPRQQPQQQSQQREVMYENNNGPRGASGTGSW